MASPIETRIAALEAAMTSLSRSLAEMVARLIRDEATLSDTAVLPTRLTGIETADRTAANTLTVVIDRLKVCEAKIAALETPSTVVVPGPPVDVSVDVNSETGVFSAEFARPPFA